VIEGGSFPSVWELSQDQFDAVVSELVALLAQSEGDRELIEAMLISVFSAMKLVPESDRGELQRLMADFTADPANKDVVSRIGAMLAQTRSSGRFH
jgi:hypothetical protein